MRFHSQSDLILQEYDVILLESVTKINLKPSKVKIMKIIYVAIYASELRDGTNHEGASCVDTKDSSSHVVHRLLYLPIVG